MITHYELGRAMAHERQTEMLRAAAARRQIHGSAGRPRRRRPVVAPVPRRHPRAVLSALLSSWNRWGPSGTPA